ncbi:hypothetical protein FC38_GL001797 [Lactobacillus gigeriorum DSM 23908 = CRBIP 24.85]|uniref:Uncharacterized protein n=1 Tax=Lactobacillus gigeriorum DSM 23908 = CRBIP 24.85 TaxID=1423751 RepID=A0ABR5PWF2_9LACO|nr:hypothetical protein FC38_GL001797 [Lactobacillus gigeriorum DSM 23908 = CRBIP 24.85]
MPSIASCITTFSERITRPSEALIDCFKSSRFICNISLEFALINRFTIKTLFLKNYSSTEAVSMI